MIGRPIIRAAAMSALLLLSALGVAPDAPAHATSGVLPPPTTLMEWIERFGVLGALVAGAVALLGHLLVVWRDTRARTYRPRVETTIECDFFLPQNEERPIELRFMVANRGGARCRLSQLAFSVRGIQKGASLTCYEGQRLQFPEKPVAGSFVPRKDWLFVDPGTTQAFTFAAKIPASLALILVRMEMKPRRGYSYIEKRVFQIPASRSKPAA